MTKKPIAIFDLDGTLARSSLLIELVRGLVREGIFPRLAEQEMRTKHRAWRNRQGTYHDYLMSVVEVFYRRIRGCDVTDVKSVGESVAQQQRRQVYVFTRTLVERYRKTHHLVTITGSPDVVAIPFARSWRFERVYPSALEAKDGIYTGEREPRMDIAEDISKFKRELLQRTIAELGAQMRGSVGVGDTESDIPILEAVAHPMVFNPNLRLVRAARANGWPVIIERKDVITRLENGTYRIDGIDE